MFFNITTLKNIGQIRAQQSIKITKTTQTISYWQVNKVIMWYTDGPVLISDVVKTWIMRYYSNILTHPAPSHSSRRSSFKIAKHFLSLRIMTISASYAQTTKINYQTIWLCFFSVRYQNKMINICTFDYPYHTTREFFKIIISFKFS